MLCVCSAGSHRTCQCSGGRWTTAWRTRHTASTATTWWADIPRGRPPSSPGPSTRLSTASYPSPLCIPLSPPGPDAQGSSPRHNTNSALPLLLFDISIYKYIQIYFKASPPRPARLAARTEGGEGACLSTLNHWQEVECAAARRGGEGTKGRTPVNVVIRFCLPCIETTRETKCTFSFVTFWTMFIMIDFKNPQRRDNKPTCDWAFYRVVS